jgi:hypothetical protein
MPELPTFREWLGTRSPTVPLLEEHLRGLGGEWLRTEHKAATEDIEFGLRRAVCALHNTRGGDVFLGVRSDRSVASTAVAVERIRQVLSQGDVRPPNDACIVDLNPAIRSVLEVEDGIHRAVVLEIARTGKVGLLVDEHNKFQLCYRRGDETLEADAGKVIEWYRLARREELLVSIYRELKAYSMRIRPWTYLPEFPAPSLPFLAARMADGSLYTLLSDDDLIAVIGGRKDTKDGVNPGFVHGYLSLVRQVTQFYVREGMDPATVTLEQALQTRSSGTSIGDYQTDLANRLREFRSWLLAQGILVD